MDSTSMCPNSLYVSNMDARSSLRWLSASATMYWHHCDSTSDPEPQNMTQVVWVTLLEATVICPWTANVLKHFVYVQYGCRKQFELAVSLNHDVLTSFWLHKWPSTPIYDPSSVGITIRGYCHMPMDSQCAKALCICLLWMWEAVWSCCQPQPWHYAIILTPQVTQNPKLWPK